MEPKLGRWRVFPQWAPPLLREHLATCTDKGCGCRRFAWNYTKWQLPVLSQEVRDLLPAAPQHVQAAAEAVQQDTWLGWQLDDGNRFVAKCVICEAVAAVGTHGFTRAPQCKLAFLQRHQKSAKHTTAVCTLLGWQGLDELHDMKALPAAPDAGSFLRIFEEVRKGTATMVSHSVTMAGTLSTVCPLDNFLSCRARC